MFYFTTYVGNIRKISNKHIKTLIRTPTHATVAGNILKYFDPFDSQEGTDSDSYVGWVSSDSVYVSDRYVRVSSISYIY